MTMPPIMAKPIGLSQADLRALFEYEPETGFLRWKERDRVMFNADKCWRTWNSRFAGAIAGTKKQSAGKQYIQVSLDGRVYPSHRLIWVFLHGSIDETLVIDHVNGVGTDNRLANLRLVAHSENQKNITMRRDNKTGVMGVRWEPDKRKWHAQISADRVRTFLGYFDSFEEAVAVRRLSEKQNGFHQFHGLSPELRAALV